MKNYILLSVIAPVLLLGAAALLSHKTYRVERVINAPAEKIWAVLMNTAAYGDWNPVFVKVDGTYRAGSKVQNTFQDPSGKLFEVTNSVVTVTPNRELRQKGGMPGVITFDHQWLLQPVEGGTRVTQFEIDRGIWLWFWNSHWVEPAYEDVLVELERYVVGD